MEDASADNHEGSKEVTAKPRSQRGRKGARSIIREPAAEGKRREKVKVLNLAKSLRKPCLGSCRGLAQWQAGKLKSVKKNFAGTR